MGKVTMELNGNRQLQDWWRMSACLPILHLCAFYLGDSQLDTLLSLDAFWSLKWMSHIKSLTVLPQLMVFLKLDKMVSGVSVRRETPFLNGMRS